MSFTGKFTMNFTMKILQCSPYNEVNNEVQHEEVQNEFVYR